MKLAIAISFAALAAKLASVRVPAWWQWTVWLAAAVVVGPLVS